MYDELIINIIRGTLIAGFVSYWCFVPFLDKVFD